MGPDLPEGHQPEDHATEVDGLPVHYQDFGGSGPVLVLVHGLGGASINWMSSGPLLAERTRVVAPDLAGHGRTPSEDRSTSIEANTRLLDGFVSELFGGPVVLVGNSMGGLISMMAASEYPDHVAGLILVDAALPVWPDAVDPIIGQMFMAYQTPGLGEAFLTAFAEGFGIQGAVEQYLALCCVDPSRVAPEVVRAHVDLQLERDQDRDQEIQDFLGAARSTTNMLMDADRWRRMQARITVPALILQGSHDRLVPRVCGEALAQLRPDWTLRVLQDIGHVPMLEDPAGFAREVLDWLHGAGHHVLQTAEHAEALRPLS